MNSHHDRPAVPALVDNPNRVAAALGSSEPVRLRPELAESDQLTVLAERLANRLVSNGGRPSDPNWTTHRRVPFRDDVWRHIQSTAAQMSSSTGYRVSPAQLCSQLIEDSLEQLDEAATRAFKHRNPPPEE